MKPRSVKPKLHRRSLYFLNFVLISIPMVYFGYQPLLRASASILIIHETPAKSDAIAVLAGGEPGRPWEAADLYNRKLAPYVIVTHEPAGAEAEAEAEALQRHGIELADGRENYLRVLRGFGVPEDRIITVVHDTDDTLDEMIRIHELCEQRKWKSLIVVTSNYHTRRTRLIARYVLGPDTRFTVVGATHGGLGRDWWKNHTDLRTFLIEFEKLVAYTIYLGPRIIL